MHRTSVTLPQPGTTSPATRPSRVTLALRGGPVIYVAVSPGDRRRSSGPSAPSGTAAEASMFAEEQATLARAAIPRRHPNPRPYPPDVGFLR
ncbi:unnamed protein product, partial [Gadus morhua 'NCC']